MQLNTIFIETIVDGVRIIKYKFNPMGTIKGTFTSVWDGCDDIVSDAELNEDTGEITSECIEVSDEYEVLLYEYFTDEEGNDYIVCPDCHTFILTAKMFSGIGNCYDEVSICSDSNCISKL